MSAFKSADWLRAKSNGLLVRPWVFCSTMELSEEQVVGVHVEFWEVLLQFDIVFFRNPEVLSTSIFTVPLISLVGLRSETVFLWDPVEQYMEVGKHLRVRANSGCEAGL